MKTISDVNIVNMTRADLDEAVKWAATEGWNPGLHDAETFFDLDPAGFFVAKIDNERVGFISGVAYDDNYGFAGFFIVRPDLRKHNIGHLLAERAAKHLGKRNIGTDGVVAEQENYKKMGFKLAYKNFRFKGKTSSTTSSTSPYSAKIISSSELNEICEFDKKFFPVDRKKFLQKWLTQQQSIAMSVRKDGKLAGYGVIRPAQDGARIGPLFCNDIEVATNLIRALSAEIGTQQIYIDIPEKNPAAVKIMMMLKFEKVFETARMYSKNEPIVNINGIFGVTSFELG